MRYCSIDYGLVVMCACLAGALGLVAGKLLSDWERRHPPNG